MVPRPTGLNEIHVARAGARFGSELPCPHTADLRILLRADRTLRVQVIDHAGQAAGGVALRLMMTWSDAGEPSLVDLGVTDDVGMLVAPHVQEKVLAEQRRRARSGPPTSLAVSPQLQGIEATGMSIDLDQLPPESLRLQIPPTGSVALEVIDKRESQSGAFLTTSLLSTIATAREVLSAQAASAIGFEEQPAQRGMRVVFPFVGLGGRLRTAPQALGRQPDAIQIEVVGPRSAGEEVLVRVSLPAPGPLLRARVLDDAGRPLRRRHVSAHLAIGDERTARTDTTDGDGELWLPIGARFVGQPVQSVQLEGLRAAYWGASGRMVRVEPSGITVGGITHLGDLTLHEAPRIASGRVVDDIGRPVDEVGLDVYPVMVPGESKRPIALPVSVRLRPNGAFEIRGFVRDEELEIRREGRDDFEPESVRFRPGVDDLRIVLRRVCFVLVELVHDLPFEQIVLLRLHAVNVANQAEHTQSVSVPIDAQRARLVLGQLPIGRYSIQVRLPHDPVPLAVVDGVEVTRGIANDPRLREVDMRGRVRVVHVQVVEGDGQPIRGEGRLDVPSASNAALASMQLRDGVFRVPLGTSAVHATIRVKGWCDHDVHDLDADRTIRLQPAFAVRVRLAPQVALPQGVTLHAFTRRKGQGVPPDLKSMRERRGPIYGSGDPGELQAEPGVFLFRIARADDYEFTFVLAGKPDVRSVAVPTTSEQARVERRRRSWSSLRTRCRCKRR